MTKSNTKVATEVAAAPAKAKSAPIMSLAELAKYQAKHGLTTKSATIRKLDSEGHSRMSIAKTLNIRYQHVRNVLTENIQTNS